MLYILLLLLLVLLMLLLQVLFILATSVIAHINVIAGIIDVAITNTNSILSSSHTAMHIVITTDTNTMNVMTYV